MLGADVRLQGGQDVEAVGQESLEGLFVDPGGRNGLAEEGQQLVGIRIVELQHRSVEKFLTRDLSCKSHNREIGNSMSIVDTALIELLCRT